MIDGRAVDYFSGCGYLGLQNHPAVIQAAVEALQKYGLSTATSRGGYGEHPVYDELEKQTCTYFAAEKMIYFASCYMGASILTQSDTHPQDHYFIDSCAHFSLWDAAAITNRPVTPFHHCNPAALAACLKNELQPGERPILLTDGLFPISGEIVPLPAYLEQIECLHGQLIVDDAHAVGVLGANGRGTMEHFAIRSDACHVTGTFNKALGGFGGFLYGNARWVDQVEQNSRICIGSSPPPLPAAAASAKALQIVRATPSMLQTLHANVNRAQTGLRSLGWNLPDSPSPILCLAGRDGINLLKIRSELFKQGIAIEYINNYPSAPAGGALRIAIFSTHTGDQIDRMIQAVAKQL